MERVETLLQKLQQQFNDGAQPAQLLLTVQMLQHELLHLQQSGVGSNAGPVAVSMPLNVIEPVAEVAPERPAEEERTVEVLQIDEAEIEAELEEIKKNAAAMQKISVQSRPQLLFDHAEDEEEVPTLAQHRPVQKPVAKETKEINEQVAHSEASLNDKLKINKIELSEKFNESGIKDLRKAIGVNDRFLYIRELFRDDEAMYERSIKTINSFSIWPEAEYWIRRELKTKLGWIDSNETVKQFDQLIKRRFS